MTTIRKISIAMLLSCFCFFSFSAQAQTKDEIINGSYLVAFGRFANKSELNYWRQNVGNRTIQQMVANHQQYLNTNQYEREETVKRSYMDAFGWNPSADELRYWSGQKKTYAALMSNHVNNWLNVYPDKRQHVIRQSYYKVFNRDATSNELRYWMNQPTYTFVQLVATHSTWKQQNQNNSKVTSVTPSITWNGISTFGFSPQAISGVVAAGGMNVIAPGGGNVIAAGGMNAVSAGGGN